ncbi:MAG: hypothetical protein HKN26_01735 [Acidimicrobiales bacterium]|nr:hypothetical protein [Acidimicrobiales bacterium]
MRNRRSSTELEAFGLTVALPAGWDGEIFKRPVDFASTAAAGTEAPSLHAANFSLPAERGDFGSGAVDIMGRRGVLVCLNEYDAESARSVLFSAEGVPQSLHPDDFATDTLQRPQAGQAGAQRFFHVGDRGFCLYVVIGSHSLRAMLVPVANEVLAGIKIAG